MDPAIPTKTMPTRYSPLLFLCSLLSHQNILVSLLSLLSPLPTKTFLFLSSALSSALFNKSHSSFLFLHIIRALPRLQQYPIRPISSVLTYICSLASSSIDRPKMASEVVMVDEFQFPKSIAPTASKALHLVGYGITDMEIHFLQIKFTAIGIYLNAEVASHLQGWKGKSGAEILADDDFFDSLCGAPVDKFIRVVVIKELKGAQYGLQLENAVRDRLAAIDKFEEEEEEALEKLVEFFQGKYLKKNSLITYNFSASTKTVEVSFLSEGKEENKLAKTVLENENVAAMIKKWYLGGSSAVSQNTVKTLADGMAALLKQ